MYYLTLLGLLKQAQKPESLIHYFHSSKNYFQAQEDSFNAQLHYTIENSVLFENIIPDYIIGVHFSSLKKESFESYRNDYNIKHQKILSDTFFTIAKDNEYIVINAKGKLVKSNMSPVNQIKRFLMSISKSKQEMFIHTSPSQKIKNDYVNFKSPKKSKILEDKVVQDFLIKLLEIIHQSKRMLPHNSDLIAYHYEVEELNQREMLHRSYYNVELDSKNDLMLDSEEIERKKRKLTRFNLTDYNLNNFIKSLLKDCLRKHNREANVDDFLPYYFANMFLQRLSMELNRCKGLIVFSKNDSGDEWVVFQDGNIDFYSPAFNEKMKFKNIEDANLFINKRQNQYSVFIQSLIDSFEKDKLDVSQYSSSYGLLQEDSTLFIPEVKDYFLTCFRLILKELSIADKINVDFI